MNMVIRSASKCLGTVEGGKRVSSPSRNALIWSRVYSQYRETLDLSFLLLGTRQQGVPVILRDVVLPGGFDPVSPSFIVRDVATELSGPRLTSCRTEIIDCRLYTSIKWISLKLKKHLT
ncbi:unnamed protein product [Schistosoma curassoni]|uniref:Uncharacterized protein n=1 Tax=Schistosoma curassoni TaxID=6186 RepID=A0A183KH65_9TREM|nr:unnamed protein product [Schistosoma curassoni]